MIKKIVLLHFEKKKTQIGEDIFSTDKTHLFFPGDDNPNVELLLEILMTYFMHNFDRTDRFRMCLGKQTI